MISQLTEEIRSSPLLPRLPKTNRFNLPKNEQMPRL